MRTSPKPICHVTSRFLQKNSASLMDCGAGSAGYGAGAGAGGCGGAGSAEASTDGSFDHLSRGAAEGLPFKIMIAPQVRHDRAGLTRRTASILELNILI